MRYTERVKFHHMISISVLISFVGCSGRGDFQSGILTSLTLPENSRQILFVTVSSWNDVQGTLRLFGRTESGWKAECDDIPVVLGRNGLGWGRGLHALNLAGPQKMEGDGRAPAGVFDLGTSFGYDLQRPDGSSYPYRQAAEHDYFIDDVDSPTYNQWQSLDDSADTDPYYYWTSFERMRRDDDLYELGIVVKHNMDPVEKGRGSAIFFHVWRGPDQPTAGCTAMSKEHLLTLLRWLDPSKYPLLVQVPENVLKKGLLRIDH
ncbi:MAG: L,D-transpeptidase family protein [Gemmatimonadota bacterium]|nr:MAG: L,D-transpeptidase family protein [Gemmatimonadota bacterium]